MSALNLIDQPKSSLLRRQRRREKSRDAARFRRHKESDTFDEICNTIPVPHDAINHLDKSAVMRLLISYIKLRQALNGKPATPHFPVIKQEYEDDLNFIAPDDYVNALNAFILVLSSDLDILYVSDNVKQYLGLSKLELIGQSILTYAHEGDHDNVRGCFSQEDSSSDRSFFLRLKSTLTISGKSINLKSASYKVLRCSGVVKTTAEDTSYFVAHVEPIPHPSNIQLFLDSKTFVSQHSPDMRFTYCDERFAKLLKCQDADVLNHSFFDFCHAADVRSVGEFFHKLYRLNQMETGRYRILAKTGGYHWVVTQATVITNQKNHKPQCVVCVHYVISDLVQGDIALSSEQWRCARALSAVPVSSLSLETLEMDGIEENDVTSEILAQMSEGETSSSGGDDCSVAPLNFTELDENEKIFGDDIYFNAPSIGDPWSYSANENSMTGKIDDIFTDVVLDGTLQESPPISSTSHMMTSPSGFFGPPAGSFGPSTPCGSLSPCDSAYCGSPLQSRELPQPYTQNDLSSSVQRLAKSSTQPSTFPRSAYQPVAVPRDKYSSHVKNLKRGFVECMSDDDAVSEWPMSRKQAPYREAADPELAKRPCLDTNMMLPPCDAQAQPVRNFSYSDLMKTPSVLMLPGDGFGFNETSVPDGAASFLLQPEMSFTKDEGRRITKNMSNGFLPQLSIHDCEVNAPLPSDCFPLAVDCVHALDDGT